MQFFSFQMLFLLVIFFTTSWLLFKLSSKLRGSTINSCKIFSLIGISIGLMCLPGGLMMNLYDIVSIVSSRNKGVDYALSQLNIQPYDYTKLDNIQAKPGKNIVVISLESFEKGLLGDSLAHLTPNIRQLAKDMTFLEMDQGQGSSWTSGAVYTMLTGIPAFFSSNSNNTFYNIVEMNTPGLPQVLSKAGYQLSYLMSKPEYGGMDEMLEAFGFKVNPSINTTNFPNNEIPDLDLFNSAKKQLLKYKTTEQPFAMFLSTISTHFPDGIYDKRMEAAIPPKLSNLEFMVAAVDHMVGDFVQFMENEGLLENTIIYLLPDHLLMGHGARVMSALTHPRGLYVISNASKERLKVSGDNRIQQIDLPKLMLNGGEVEHNAKFLCDFLTKNSKAKFIAEHKQKLSVLNESFLFKKSSMKIANFKHKLAGWKNSIKARIHKFVYSKNVDKSDVAKISKETKRFIAHAGGVIDGVRYTNSLEALNNSYAKGFRLFELDIIKTSDNYYVAAHDWKSWSKIHQYDGLTPVTLKEFLKHKINGKYTPLDIERINKWFGSHPDAVLVTDKINEPRKFASKFIDKKRLMMELFSIEAAMEAIDEGVSFPMISQNVFYRLKQKGAVLEQLKSMNIHHMALSRGIIEQNIPLFLKLYEEGIKIYVYHVNATPTFNENYVVNNELGYVYGLYADDWDFASTQ